MTHPESPLPPDARAVPESVMTPVKPDVAREMSALRSDVQSASQRQRGAEDDQVESVQL